MSQGVARVLLPARRMPTETQMSEAKRRAISAKRDNWIRVASPLLAIMIACTAGSAKMPSSSAFGPDGGGGAGGTSACSGPQPSDPCFGPGNALGGWCGEDAEGTFLCVDGQWGCPPGTFTWAQCHFGQAGGGGTGASGASGGIGGAVGGAGGADTGGVTGGADGGQTRGDAADAADVSPDGPRFDGGLACDSMTCNADEVCVTIVSGPDGGSNSYGCVVPALSCGATPTCDCVKNTPNVLSQFLVEACIFSCTLRGERLFACSGG
jgi:hypothetical protein